MQSGASIVVPEAGAGTQGHGGLEELVHYTEAGVGVGRARLADGPGRLPVRPGMAVRVTPISAHRLLRSQIGVRVPVAAFNTWSRFSVRVRIRPSVSILQYSGILRSSCSSRRVSRYRSEPVETGSLTEDP